MLIRAIFVWPWNENARTKKKQKKNGNSAIWLVYWTDTNAPSFWLVKGTLGWKNFLSEELSRNRFDVILQHDWSIEQCLLHIRVFFGGKTKSPCSVLFIHWLIKQITNTYRNHFSRTYENRSIAELSGAKRVQRITMGKKIWENLVITWPCTDRPLDRPSTPQPYQCKITQLTGMATQTQLEVLLTGNRLATRVLWSRDN